MRFIDPNGRHIDYFQSPSVSRRGLKSCFGIRLQDRLCVTIIKFGDGQTETVSNQFNLPIQFKSLPGYVRLVVEDHLLNCPKSDLMDVLTGAKSFHEALTSPSKIEVKSTTANQALRLATAC